MILSFHPKRGAMPKWPGKGPGSYPYVGRSFDVDTRANRANKSPASLPAHGADGRLTDDARRLVELCARDGDLLPADKATAEFCGVAFVALEQDADGEWAPAKSADARAKSPKAGE